MREKTPIAREDTERALTASPFDTDMDSGRAAPNTTAVWNKENSQLVEPLGSKLNYIRVLICCAVPLFFFFFQIHQLPEIPQIPSLHKSKNNQGRDKDIGNSFSLPT